MALKIKKANNHYKALNTTSIRDKNLSLKATGLLSYFMTKPDGWHGQIYEVCQNKPDGRDSVRSAMKELVNFGYAVLKKYPPSEDGKFHGSYYEISDEPNLKTT